MAVAYINERLRQKNASGDYDIMHLESESSLILRSADTAGTFKTGTVEDALTALESDVTTLKARNVELTGDVSGTGVLNGNNIIVVDTEVSDDSHGHTGSTVTIAGATDGNFLAVDASGHPVDSTKKASDFAATSHIHGKITKDGKLSSDVAHASGDKLVLADSSDGTVQRSDIALGSDTTKFLNNSGAWTVPPGTYTHPTKTAVDAAAVKVGNDGLGHVVLGDALTYTDVGAAPSDHTHNYAGSESVGGAANSVKASLTVGNKTFNGSAAVTITAADLGLSAAMSFIGITTTALTDGATTNPITIDGASVTAQKGNVALYNGLEFLWTGSKWQQLGDESSYALKSHTHGNITNDGKITSDTAVASGDKIVMVDASDNKVQRSGIAIGTDTTKYLRNDGTWGTPAGTYTHPSYTAIAEGFRKVGRDATGHVISAAAVAADDVKGLTGIDMTGASASAPGTHGMVPAPSAGDQNKVLSGAGTWVEQSSYTHPTQTAKEPGANKIGNDALGHVIIGGALTYTDVGAAASSHTHGKITNDGKITSDTAAANGDKLILADATDGTVQRSGIAIGTDTTKYLRNDGTWAVPYAHPTTTAVSAAAVKVGKDGLGHVVLGGALAFSDIVSGGVLPIANGGTGGTTAAEARASLGVINVQSGSSQPTNQAAGDLWYETI